MPAPRPEPIEIPDNRKQVGLEISRAADITAQQSGTSLPVKSPKDKAIELVFGSEGQPPASEGSGAVRRSSKRSSTVINFAPTRVSVQYPRIDTCVKSTEFESLVGAAICLNCVPIFVEVNGLVKSYPSWVSDVSRIAEHCFTTFFLVEFFLKVSFLGWKSFAPCVRSSVPRIEVVLNFFDALLVWVTGVGFVWIWPLFIHERAGWLRMFTALRAARLFRLARVVRKLPAFREVYVLLRGLSDSTRILFWTMIVIGFITYIFAIFGVVFVSTDLKQQLQDKLQELDPSLPEENDEIRLMNGLMDTVASVEEWMFTLVQLLTLDSWTGILRPLSKYSWFASIIFFSYIALVVIVFMNLVTAVIVENALAQSKHDEEAALAQQEEDEKKTLKKFQELFEMMDEDGDSQLTWEEFDDAFTNPEVAIKLKLLNFKQDDCKLLFNLLDQGDGSLTIDEFFEGLESMKGPAKSKDVFILSKRVQQIWNFLVQFGSESQSDTKQLFRAFGVHAPRRKGTLARRAKERGAIDDGLTSPAFSPETPLSPEPGMPHFGRSLSSADESRMVDVAEKLDRIATGLMNRIDTLGQQMNTQLQDLSSRVSRVEAHLQGPLRQQAGPALRSKQGTLLGRGCPGLAIEPA
eukprot:TRINITY_DN91452_c0_g1_i1.p1 TRINITY_DN91452_c0_g1~~TRINITY_DN91452_c0_g1_i1.p1  ORF type:complete len:634 (+),score=127.78 TRINITY_DN91452_c0_g1_i1:66-1967(+)